MKLQTGIGRSEAVSAPEAGAEAAAAALGGLHGATPALLIVYASSRYDLPALLQSIRGVFEGVPLVGAATAGHFANGQMHSPLEGVQVLALAEGPYRFGVASLGGLDGDLDQAGQALARESRERAGAAAHGALVLFTDWLVGDHQQLVQGIYRVSGPNVPTVGGAAGDALEFAPTVVFHDDQVIRKGAAALWIASDHPLRVVTRHGWEPTGVPILVTDAKGMDILELGGRSAAATYREQLGWPAEPAVDHELFRDRAITHPLAVLGNQGALLIRTVVSQSPEGWLNLTSHVPSGSAVQVTSGSADTLLAAASLASREALMSCADPSVILAFSCMARTMVYGDRVGEEPRLFQEAAGDVPTFGFFTYGEYSRTRGVQGTHTATITALAL